MVSKVAIWMDEDAYSSTWRALELIKDDIVGTLERWQESGNGKVLIKPNLLSTNKNFKCNTSVETCLAIADFVKEIGDFDISVGDGTTWEKNKQPSTIRALENHGYAAYLDKWEFIELHDDDTGAWFDIVNLEANEPIELGVAKAAVDSFLISVAKFKTHDVLGLTLSLKNLMGALNSARSKKSGNIIKTGDVKGFMHGFWDKKPHLLTREQNIGPSKVALAANLVRLAKCVQPGLAVVDGSTVMEGSGPRRGDVCEQLGGISVAGIDFIAVDSICARIVKIPLESFQYVMAAGKAGVGNYKKEDIEVLGLDVEKIQTEIKPHPRFKESAPWKPGELSDFQKFLD
ncbi:MAG: DUF362 domain-containing protein [Promethearchaeota archaeon]